MKSPHIGKEGMLDSEQMNNEGNLDVFHFGSVFPKTIRPTMPNLLKIKLNSCFQCRSLRYYYDNHY
ncbi:hypothetical protein DYY67_0180 [Candidatus Nitrosotalea sp. TS]|nr:hypothetical protein [Candidatus Nitrosotalea sp. TS]